MKFSVIQLCTNVFKINLNWPYSLSFFLTVKLIFSSTHQKILELFVFILRVEGRHTSGSPAECSEASCGKLSAEYMWSHDYVPTARKVNKDSSQVKRFSRLWLTVLLNVFQNCPNRCWISFSILNPTPQIVACSYML